MPVPPAPSLLPPAREIQSVHPSIPPLPIDSYALLSSSSHCARFNTPFQSQAAMVSSTRHASLDLCFDSKSKMEQRLNRSSDPPPDPPPQAPPHPAQSSAGPCIQHRDLPSPPISPLSSDPTSLVVDPWFSCEAAAVVLLVLRKADSLLMKVADPKGTSKEVCLEDVQKDMAKARHHSLAQDEAISDEAPAPAYKVPRVP